MFACRAERPDYPATASDRRRQRRDRSRARHVPPHRTRSIPARRRSGKSWRCHRCARSRSPSNLATDRKENQWTCRSEAAGKGICHAANLKEAPDPPGHHRDRVQFRFPIAEGTREQIPNRDLRIGLGPNCVGVVLEHFSAGRGECRINGSQNRSRRSVWEIRSAGLERDWAYKANRVGVGPTATSKRARCVASRQRPGFGLSTSVHTGPRRRHLHRR